MLVARPVCLHLFGSAGPKHASARSTDTSQQSCRLWSSKSILCPFEPFIAVRKVLEMHRVRCLQAASDLLLPHTAFAVSADSSVLQRLQSSLFCSTSSSTASSSIASVPAVPNAARPRQQHRCPSFAARGYARMPTRRPKMQLQDMGIRLVPRDPNPGPLPPLTRLPLGRSSEHCVPTEELREPFFLDQYDPWTDDDPRTLRPRMVSGQHG